MFPPGGTGSALSSFVTTRSADGDTDVLAVPVLFVSSGSVVDELTVATFPIVDAGGVPGSTLTTSVNIADAPEASDAVVAVAVPVSPTAGVLSVNAGPLDWLIDTNVVEAGISSVSVTDCAAFGPAFETTIVYVMFEFGVTGSGESVFVTARSATSAAEAAPGSASKARTSSTSGAERRVEGHRRASRAMSGSVRPITRSTL